MTRQEENAIESIALGHTDAFGILYDIYAKPIYKFIYLKTHHRPTAEDLTSQTFVKALERVHSYKKLKGEFSTWLYQIARNTVIDHFRTSHPTLAIEDVWGVGIESTVPRDIDMRDKLSHVEKTLAELAPNEREMILMRVWGDMSYAEIAAALGKSEDSCKMMYSRAIRKLRSLSSLGLLLLLMYK